MQAKGNIYVCRLRNVLYCIITLRRFGIAYNLCIYTLGSFWTPCKHGHTWRQWSLWPADEHLVRWWRGSTSLIMPPTPSFCTHTHTPENEGRRWRDEHVGKQKDRGGERRAQVHLGRGGDNVTSPPIQNKSVKILLGVIFFTNNDIRLQNRDRRQVSVHKNGCERNKMSRCVDGGTYNEAQGKIQTINILTQKKVLVKTYDMGTLSAKLQKTIFKGGYSEE